MRALYNKKDEGIGLLSAIILIIVITVVLTSTIVFFYHLNSTTKPYTSPAIYNTEPNLNLTLLLSSFTLTKGEGLSISEELFNNESYSFTVAVSNNWPYFQGVQYRMTMDPCPDNLPFGFVILKGDYNLTTYSQGQPLMLYEPNVIYMCPAEFPINSYEFLPFSDHVLILSNVNPPINFTLENSILLNGSWSYVGSKAVFSNFPPGIYTVVAADEWGEIQIAHFSVT